MVGNKYDTAKKQEAGLTELTLLQRCGVPPFAPIVQEYWFEAIDSWQSDGSCAYGDEAETGN